MSPSKAKTNKNNKAKTKIYEIMHSLEQQLFFYKICAINKTRFDCLFEVVKFSRGCLLFNCCREIILQTKTIEVICDFNRQTIILASMHEITFIIIIPLSILCLMNYFAFDDRFSNFVHFVLCSLR